MLKMNYNFSFYVHANSGDTMETIIDIIIRSILSIIVLFLITELMGKKQINQLNLFDYIIGISIGSIAASLSVDDSINYIDGVVTIAVYGVSATIISIITTKSILFRRFFTGTPSILMAKGKIIYKNLKKSRLDINDLLQLARESGYYDISQLNYAILEPSGKVSFLPKAKYVPVTPNDSKIKVSENGIVSNLIIDGKYMKENIQNIGKDTNWVEKRLHNMGYSDISKILLVTCDNKEQLSIFLKEEKPDNIDILE